MVIPAEAKIKINGLHILLTYQCTFECDHCFVWGSPWQSGVLTLAEIRHILNEAKAVGVEWIYFEGGEPFLYYPNLLEGVRLSAGQGFQVGIVTNSYWAISEEDARLWLQPFAGLVQDLSVSSDLFHYSEIISQQAKNASQAAEQLGLPTGVITIAQPETEKAAGVVGQIPTGEGQVMYRGRAAEVLAKNAPHHSWDTYTTCPYEDLRDPGRLHLDPLGYLHICQGIVIGNIFQEPLAAILERYDPDAHPITGPLLLGGPVELVHHYALPHQEAYADACHLCYSSRLALRQRFPDILAPDQVYGIMKG
ncbi:MAG: hypothetical protein JXB15_07810 [Anaerolineales bacterium]|nr:hypothetical protein [Anaerolineales bacterium]